MSPSAKKGFTVRVEFNLRSLFHGNRWVDRTKEKVQRKGMILRTHQSAGGADFYPSNWLAQGAQGLVLRVVGGKINSTVL